MTRFRMPSPALVIALVSLFVGLSGTAVAAGIVPLAKRALTADKAGVAKTATLAKTATFAKTAGNAMQLGGSSAANIAALPGPASTAAGLVSNKQIGLTVAKTSIGSATATCGSGEHAVGGGYLPQGSGFPLVMATGMTQDASGWTVTVANLDDQTDAIGFVQVLCLK